MFIVEMFRTPPGAGKPDVFDCPGALWQKAGEVGMAFGWIPHGVEVQSQVRSFTREEGWRKAYWPGTWGGSLPRVTDLDARNWSQALGAALQSLCELEVDLPHEGPLILNLALHQELNGIANAGLTREFIAAFAGYLGRGGFTMAWDD